jgi:hypothetical protein
MHIRLERQLSMCGLNECVIRLIQPVDPLRGFPDLDIQLNERALERADWINLSGSRQADGEKGMNLEQVGNLFPM